MNTSKNLDPLLSKLLHYCKQTRAYERRPIQHPDQTINRLVNSKELPEKSFRKAAVLIPIFYDLDASAVVLTLRTEHLSSHPGQVAFPGGKEDPGDAGPVHTALRESQEEIGLPADAVRVIGRLGQLLMPSGYCVTPIIGLLSVTTPLVACPIEVAHIFSLPLSLALDPQAYTRSKIMVQDSERETLELQHEGYRIWGATAAILHHLACELQSPSNKSRSSLLT
jgi:8-oxo-dGTP pyrophosphatase MutT (NUDIX family)